jgi:cell division protein ZapA (FtsZ GTPase activity inhibitor)
LDSLITIELFGQSYTFKADTEAETAREIAALLTEEVARVQSKDSGQAAHIPKVTLLILAALNIATRAVQSEKTHKELIDRIAERCERLARLLDREVEPSRPAPSWG